MLASVDKPTQQNIKTKVTSISTNARIEYIMRFSKHAVLVVDQSQNVYSAVGSQFLGSMPTDHNAAFISVSPKLNDIQIRCRLIEQLFVDTLFDPEEALAVSVLNLLKNNNEVINVVVENVQLLSLQLMHEFCQLAELAAKANKAINVLLLGEEKTGQLVVENQVVFNNKLSIVSAETGQLIPLDSSMFVSSKPVVQFTPIKKAIIGISLLVLIGFFTVFSLYQTDSLSYSKLAPISEKEKVTLVDNRVLVTSKEKIITPIQEQTSQAKAEDINLILTGNANNTARVSTVANPSEVASLLSLNNTEFVDKQLEETTQNQLTVDTPQPSAEAVNNNSAEYLFEDTILIEENPTGVNTNEINEQYFTHMTQGYVAQIIGFSTKEAHLKFINQYSELDLVSYHKTLNAKPLIMVTTKAYPLKSDVQSAISLLPTELQERKPWIKSVAVINQEITAYQNSQ